MKKGTSIYGIVDLFAGPGGLAEGFSRVEDTNGERMFNIVMSVEKDSDAHSTLRLRAFFRAFKDQVPQDYYDFLNGDIALKELTDMYPEQWLIANQEAICMTLGDKDTQAQLDSRLNDARTLYGDQTILIGGPPCQAYSLVGRARNKGNSTYQPEQDNRHYLYREFLRSLETLKPAAFVMENVKGMLSSSVDGTLIARQILSDLKKACGGYELFPLTPVTDTMDSPKDFLVRSETHGVPQRRHRVIIVGIRKDLSKGHKKTLRSTLSLVEQPQSTVAQVIGNLQSQRSLVSGRRKYEEKWDDVILTAAKDLSQALKVEDKPLSKYLSKFAKDFKSCIDKTPKWDVGHQSEVTLNSLSAWLFDERVKSPTCVDARGHMPSDLVRYLFAASYAKIHNRSPRAGDFPDKLAPDHKNWKSGSFNDRFRVQLAEFPATTITSHISKDGHYYIHPDPLQCRSLTVREAARLQTFPDNYLFLGPRTSQYHQVGNAVPPYLALQIGSAVAKALNELLIESPKATRRGAKSA